MDVVFKCPNCAQELQVEAGAAGMEIECPTCNTSIQVPKPSAENIRVLNPIASSAAAREDRHYSVPVHEAPSESLIEKPLKPLDVAAKEGVSIKIKSFRHSDCIEVGRDRFDELVTQFLNKVGQESIISITPIFYSHQELATRAWITDFGVLIVYRG